MNPYFTFIPSYETTIFFPALPLSIECIIFKMKDEMEEIDRKERQEMERFRKKKIEQIHQFIRIFHYRSLESIRFTLQLSSEMWWVGKEFPDNFWKRFKEHSFWNPERPYKIQEEEYYYTFMNSHMYIA